MTIASHNELFSYVGQFSKSLYHLVSQDESLSTISGFGPFPCGGCRQSSLLLAHALNTESFQTTYVVGRRHWHGHKQDHAWLTYDHDGMSGLVDLTCCQFGDCQLQCPLVTPVSEWHSDQWEIQSTESMHDAEPRDGALLKQATLLENVLNLMQNAG